jgi:hypothetical protein
MRVKQIWALIRARRSWLCSDLSSRSKRTRLAPIGASWSDVEMRPTRPAEGEPSDHLTIRRVSNIGHGRTSSLRPMRTTSPEIWKQSLMKQICCPKPRRLQSW